MHLPATRTLLQRPTGVSFIQINLEDPAKAPEFAERLAPVLSHGVMSWQRAGKNMAPGIQRSSYFLGADGINDHSDLGPRDVQHPRHDYHR